MNNGYVASLATLSATYISKKYNMDNMMYGACYGILLHLFTILTDLNVTEVLSSTNVRIMLVVSTISACIFFKQQLFLYLRQMSVSKYGKIIISCANEAAIECYEKYIERNRDMFDIPDEYMLDGHVPSVIVRFKDTNFNVDGYFFYEKNSIPGAPDNLLIYVKSNSRTNNTNYFSQIKNFISPPTAIELHAVKCFNYLDQTGKTLPCADHQLIYSGKRMELAFTEPVYIARIFHAQKPDIWNNLKYIQESGESQTGFILHGPAGTGKSTFAYNVALALQRHIVFVDLLSYTKKDLYQIFRRPYIKGAYRTPREVVYVFDEFDLTIKQLCDREAQIKFMYENASRISEALIEKHNQLLESKTITGNKKETDIDLPKIVRNQYSNEITVSSLLELIQGPVPQPGAIFIATTNNLENITKICPQLCRPGRLTPVYFGYAENEVLQEISQYYYQESLVLKEHIISTVCTAEIINFIVSHKQQTGWKFSDFQCYVDRHSAPN